MILEIALLTVKDGMEAEFEAQAAKAVSLFRGAKGCLSMEIRRSIEIPNRYRLLIGWETLEAHTVDFRNSPDFQAWRGLVSHCFAAPPEVEHAGLAVMGF
jgi:heme-degrading monooxygenase HmoA